MPQVEVRRLNYRGAATQAGRVEFAVGDALRTETTDDGRLILVRSLQLGRIGFGERGASRAAATAWRELVGSARHGGSSGAESANCVWFTSLAEARALLMRELARGRTPFAWFWALAVPDWRRMTLAQYVEQRLALALAEPSGEAVAALVGEVVAAGAAQALAAAILARVPIAVATPEPVERSPPAVAAGRPPAPAVAVTIGAADLAEREAALETLRPVPALLYATLERLAARPDAAPLLEALTRGLAQRLHPALSVAPQRLAKLSLAVIRLLQSGQGRFAQSAEVVPESGETAKPPLADQVSPGEGEDRPSGRVRVEEPPRRPAEPASAASSDPIERAARPPAPECRELASSAAGVFLTIVPLLRLGWREWLAGHPDLLLHQPGARQLHTIAGHYRVPSGDAVWDILPQVDPTIAPPESLTEALELWRRGLDGWLRRRARLKLADLVSRKGWLLPGPETTIVRFPLNDIDIRLRRLALDGDPGWVDWLGHSYRLVYRDRPLTGPRLP